MIRFVLILLAIATIIYAVHWYRQQRRSKDIRMMTHDELVEAIIMREISILEVPSGKREAVNKILGEIQEELDEL
ncbi:hypothetical protein QUF72_03435 [Desulfobacterales bacterium HSG2]|nr:hypothetical protein [Desulfobacterales bacterium HSG2]